MKPDQCRRCIEAMTALYGPPMTDSERAEYDRLRAEEMARAERRREPTPQLELEQRHA